MIKPSSLILPLSRLAEHSRVRDDIAFAMTCIGSGVLFSFAGMHNCTSAHSSSVRLA
jgi:hypothetical protein